MRVCVSFIFLFLYYYCYTTIGIDIGVDGVWAILLNRVFLGTEL